MRKDKVCSLIVPRYKELRVRDIWDKIKDIEEYTVYFPDFAEKQQPERDYLIGIISSLNPEATKIIVKEARDKRSIVQKDNPGELVKITAEMQEELRKIMPQKSTILILQYFTY